MRRTRSRSKLQSNSSGSSSSSTRSSSRAVMRMVWSAVRCWPIRNLCSLEHPSDRRRPAAKSIPTCRRATLYPMPFPAPFPAFCLVPDKGCGPCVRRFRAYKAVIAARNYRDSGSRSSSSETEVVNRRAATPPVVVARVEAAAVASAAAALPAVVEAAAAASTGWSTPAQARALPGRRAAPRETCVP